MKKKFKNVALLATVFGALFAAPKLCFGASIKTADFDLSFKDGSIPILNGTPASSFTGSFTNSSDEEVCTELPITKWEYRTGSTGNWIEMTTEKFEAGKYYRPTFGTCTAEDETVYQINTSTSNTNGTILKANGIDVAKISQSVPEQERRYYSWNGFYVNEDLLINSINIIVTEPVVGEKPSTKAQLEADPVEGLVIAEIDIKWFVSEDGETYEEMEDGAVFESEKYYDFAPVEEEFEFNSILEEDYYFYKFLYEAMVDIGVEDSEFADVLLNGEDAMDYNGFGPLYSYKYLDETDEIKDIVGKISKLSFRVDAAIETFAGFKIGDLELVKDEDYEVTEGSTIVTLTANGLKKVNGLAAGTYTVQFLFNNGQANAVGKLILNEEAPKNPATSDNFLAYIFAGLLSVTGIATSIVVRKKFNN